jgi:hypothetical protein
MTKVRVNWGPPANEDPVRLYEIYNSASRSLLVLATDRAEAIEMAYTPNHIHFMGDRKDKSYPHAAEVRNPANERRLAYHLALIQLAVARRLRGSVHIDGENLYVGDQLIRDGN